MLRHLTSLVAIVTIGAGVAHAQVGILSGRVTDAATGEPLGDVQIQIVGSLQGTSSRPDGSYRLTVSAGRRAVRAFRIGYGSRTDSVTITAGGVTTHDFALGEVTVNLDQVVVIGSRSSDRTVLESPVPVDVLTSAEIRETGLTETSQVIQMLAPSFNFPRPSVNDGTDHVRPATLRGLGPDQTLVLINGKRRHSTALVHVNQSVGRGSTSVDLNAIPASAIERIEILRDGAAAQYGSDAIAGVINIVLKAGQEAIVGTTFGTVRSDPEYLPSGRTFKDGDVRHVEANLGLPLGSEGFVHVTGEFRDRNRTNRARVDTSLQCIAGDPRCTNVPPGTSIYDEGFIQSWQGDAETREWMFFANAALPLSSGMRLYGFGGYSLRDGLAAGFFRRSRDDRTVRDIYGNGFLPLIGSDIMDASGALGIQGAWRDWSWDLGAVYGGNTFEFSVDNSLNTSLGVTSPTSFYAGGLGFAQGTLNLDLRRTIGGTMLGPLSVAVGAELRNESYRIERGDASSYAIGTQPILDGPSQGNPAAPFAQVFPGFRPVDEVDESRTNVGAYVELEATPVARLLVSLAGRVENYSDFGSTTDGKIAARLDVARGVAVRGALQTGFRAPSLGQSFFSSVATNFVNVGGVNTPFEIRTFPVESPGGELLGAQPLQPEESVNRSAGLTLRPVDNLSFSADYYHVSIDNRIVFSGNFLGPSVEQLLADNGIPGVNGARYFTNAIDTYTEGVDLVLNYGIDLERIGLLRLTAGYNRNFTRVTRVSETPPQLAAVSTALFDRVQRNLIQRGQPRDAIKLMANHRLGNFTGTVNLSRFGEFTVYQPNTTNPLDPAPGPLDQTFGAKWVTDLALSYELLERLTFAVGGNNIFDVYPDTVITPNQTRGIYMYSGASPFGFNGAFWYVRATYELDGIVSPFRKEQLRGTRDD